MDRDNIRAAVSWALETQATETALRLLAACWRYWQIRGYLVEARGLAEQILALPDTRTFPLPFDAALDAAGGIAYWQADQEGARTWYGEALERARERGDDRALANAIYNMTFTFALSAEDQAQARALAGEALEVNRRLGDDAGIGRALWALASAEYFFGNMDGAREALVEALVLFRKVDDQFMLAWTLFMTGMTNLEHDPGMARASLGQALDMFLQTDDVSGYALIFDGFADPAHADGDLVRALQLAGFAATTEKLAGTGLNAYNRKVSDFHPEELLTTPEYQAAYAEGQHMSLERAVVIALGQEPASEDLGRRRQVAPREHDQRPDHGHDHGHGQDGEVEWIALAGHDIPGHEVVEERVLLGPVQIRQERAQDLEEVVDPQVRQGQSHGRPAPVERHAGGQGEGGESAPQQHPVDPDQWQHDEVHLVGHVRAPRC